MAIEKPLDPAPPSLVPTPTDPLAERVGVTGRLLLVLLPIIAAMTVLFALVVTQRSNSVVDDFASQHGRDLAQQEFEQSRARLVLAFEPARSLAAVVSAVAGSGNVDRQVIVTAAIERLRQSNKLLALWFFAEPDAIGRDADHLRDASGSGLAQPGTGRFLTYWARDEANKIRFSDAPLDFASQDYYTLPQRIGHDVAIAPYTYPVFGQPVLMTSVVIPVYVAGRFLGVVGGDLRVSDYAAMMDASRPLGGRIFLTNSDGSWTYNPDHSRMLEPLRPNDGFSDLTDQEIADLKANRPFVADKVGADGRHYRRYALAAPFPTAAVGPRMFLADIPMESLVAPFKGITSIIVASGLVGAILLIAFTAATVRLFIGRPLERLRNVVRHMEEGDLRAVVPETKRIDALGEMARAIDGFRQSLVDRERLRRDLKDRSRDLEQMAAAIEAAHDAIIILSRDRRVVYINRAAMQALAVPEGVSLIGEFWDEVLVPEQAERAAGFWREVLSAPNDNRFWAGQVNDWRSRFGGHVEVLDATVSLLPNDGILIVARDVSKSRQLQRERDQFQRQVMQQDKMEALGRMAGGIAHDFNNLLAAILSYADFLAEDSPPGSRQLSYAERLQTTARRARDLVRQILSFAHEEAQEVRTLKLQDVVRENRSLLQSAVPATIRLDFEMDANAPPIAADATQLTQVLMNLVVNATDACAAGGRIAVSVRAGGAGRSPGGHWDEVTVLPFDRTRPHLVLEVTDSGQGMDRGLMERMFEPFFTTKPKGRGTGLGTSVIYSAAKAMGGGLIVRSRQGVGTAVLIFIPASDSPAAEPHRPAPAVRNGATYKILVVDDDEEVVEAIAEGLQRRGHAAISCTNGEEALRALLDDDAGFEVLVTDQTMPGMSGMSLIQRVKGQRPSILCVLCTGFSEQANEVTAAAAGADVFLHKPVAIAELDALVAAIMRRPRQPSPAAG